MKPTRLSLNRRSKSQGLVEFALIAPLLLMIIYGLFEVGRLIFTYSSVVTAAREAVRYGSTTGVVSGQPQYKNCTGIRNAAQKVDFLGVIDDTNIDIYYYGPTGTLQNTIDGATCPAASAIADVASKGYIKVKVTATFSPVVSSAIVPLGTVPLTSWGQRTILGSVDVTGNAAAPSTTYTLTVVNGTGGGTYPQGMVVTITANAPATGKMFDKWTGSTSTIADVNAASTTLIMPAASITVTATYKDIPYYTLTVNYGTGGGNYPQGTVVSIVANPPASNYTFDKWTGSTSTIANINAYSTTLTMPAANITVTATYKVVSGGLNPPQISKSFLTNPMGVGQSTVLQFTITNPNSSSYLDSVAFSDTYPSGLTNVSPLNTSNTCGGSVTASAGGSSIALSSGTIAAGGSCTVQVSLTSSTVGTYSNTSGTVTSSNGGNGNKASASLSVIILPPSISKYFSPPTISANGVSALTFTISNPNTSNTLSGIAFSDTYPTGIVNINPLDPPVSNTCGGTATASAGGNSIAISGAALAAGAWCSVTVNVTSATSGTYSNTSSTITATESTGSGASATASLMVLSVPLCTFSSTSLSSTSNNVTWNINNTAAVSAVIYNIGATWNSSLYLTKITIDSTQIFYQGAVAGPPFPAIQDFYSSGTFSLAAGTHALTYTFCTYSDCHGSTNILSGSKFGFAVRFSTSGCAPLSSGQWTKP